MDKQLSVEDERLRCARIVEGHTEFVSETPLIQAMLFRIADMIRSGMDNPHYLGPEDFLDIHNDVNCPIFRNCSDCHAREQCLKLGELQSGRDDSIAGSDALNAE